MSLLGFLGSVFDLKMESKEGKPTNASGSDAFKSNTKAHAKTDTATLQSGGPRSKPQGANFLDFLSCFFSICMGEKRKRSQPKQEESQKLPSDQTPNPSPETATLGNDKIEIIIEREDKSQLQTLINMYLHFQNSENIDPSIKLEGKEKEFLDRIYNDLKESENSDQEKSFTVQTQDLHSANKAFEKLRLFSCLSTLDFCNIEIYKIALKISNSLNDKSLGKIETRWM